MLFQHTINIGRDAKTQEFIPVKDAQGNGGIAVHSTPVAPVIESERFGRKRVPKIAEGLTVFIYCGYRRAGGYPAMAPCFRFSGGYPAMAPFSPALGCGWMAPICGLLQTVQTMFSVPE